MTFVVVTAVDKKNNTFHTVGVDSNTYTTSIDYGFITAEALAKLSYSAGGSNSAPLNFSVDRAGKIVQDCGDFNRFSSKGSAVVIAEIKSKGGRTMGYRLLSCLNNVCANLRLEEILQKEASMGKDEHFLQNGIIRNKTVNCYPNRPFLVMTVATPKKPTPAKAPTADTLPHYIDKKDMPKEAQAQPQPKPEYTPAQLKELHSCRTAGVPTNLIRNPDLSPEQMRVLWVSKSKGCLSEYFNDPAYSADAMKFYADRLYDKQTVVDCAEMLEHPELTVPQLTELYSCVCQGIPYTDYIGMSATDIGVKRDMSTTQYWGSSAIFEDDSYVEKAIGAAMRLHSEG